MSSNPTYTIEPTAHSPNIKNFTNDELVSPPNSPQYAVISRIDPELMAYAADTANFAHTAAQGPYYIGPWYVNEAGQRIDGAYVDVSLAHAVDLQDATLDSIVYAAGFDSDPSSCIDAELLRIRVRGRQLLLRRLCERRRGERAAGPRPMAGPAGLSEAAR